MISEDSLWILLISVIWCAQTACILLEVWWKESIDLAFINTDEISYTEYYECCLKLIRPGGLILVDNVLWSGQVADASNHDKDTEALRIFNAALSSDQRVDLCMVPIGDGLTIARKR